MIKLIYLWLQAACINAQFLTSQSWSTWTSTFPNEQMSVADAWNCQRIVTLSDTLSTRSGCPDVWWHRQNTTTIDEAVTTARTSAVLSTCSTLTWTYGTKISRNDTMPRKPSQSEYTTSSYNRLTASFSDFTKTITSTISRTVTATLLSASTISQSLTSSNEVLVKPTVIETLITRTIPTKTVTKTHTHSATFIIIVTINLLCTCDENELFVTSNAFPRLKFQSSYFSQRLYFQLQAHTRWYKSRKRKFQKIVYVKRY